MAAYRVPTRLFGDWALACGEREGCRALLGLLGINYVG